MDEYRIRITRQAKQHLQEIRRHIEKELLAPQAALNTVRKLRMEIQKIADMPQRFKPIDEEPWGSEGVRKIYVNNYCIETAVEL